MAKLTGDQHCELDKSALRLKDACEAVEEAAKRFPITVDDMPHKPLRDLWADIDRIHDELLDLLEEVGQQGIRLGGRS